MLAKFLIVFVITLGMTILNPIALAADEVHEGKVLSVGTNSITVTDDKDGDNDTFTIDSSTKITMNGKPARLTDLHAGDRAKVTATPKGDKLLAKEITARSPE
jgi:hypothetical protein